MSVKAAERKCAVCGIFYPANPDELRANIREMINAARPAPIEGRVRGVIGPHAGYVYSGPTAAHAYSLLQGASYDTVVVVSPSHREYFDGVSVFAGESYATPLGVVSIDKRLREEVLEEKGVVKCSYAGHGEEHAVEVHLPFLQCVLGDFKLLPIVMGDQKREYCRDLGETLGRVLHEKNALLVASTDLSHYYSAEIANRLDSVVIDAVKNFDYERLMLDLDENRAEACGGGPTVAVMLALHRLGVRKITVLHHCNSGDVIGDHSQVVGYLAAVAHA